MTDRGALITYGGYALDDPESGEALRAAGVELQISPRANDRTASQLLGLIGDAVAVIADADPFEAMVFEHAPNLRVIARTGVGLDSIDLDAATRAGVVVTITPNVNHETVADHALMLMLACVRRVSAQDAAVRAGGWRTFGSSVPGQLHGAAVGLIGYGAIGRAVARRLRAFDVHLLVHDPLIDGESVDGARLVDLDELLERSTLVSIHAPLTSSTRGMIDADRIARMRPGAILVNTSRGPIVCEEPLLAALESGRLSAAGLDVFAVEPPGVCPLTQLPNVVLSPHIGGISDISNLEMSRAATRSVLAVLDNRRPESAVNPDALAVRGRVA
jgi:D-3-phosphoglycerate dehydrogenase